MRLVVISLLAAMSAALMALPISARAQSVTPQSLPAESLSCDGTFDPDYAKTRPTFPFDALTTPGKPPDYERTLENLRKRIATGDAQAMAGLGMAYFYAEGVKRNTKCTEQLLTRAADLGDVWAMDTLGEWYRGMVNFPRNYYLSREWLEKAAAGGVRQAALTVAWMYDSGQGVQPDGKRAAEYYEKFLNWPNPPRNNIEDYNTMNAAYDLGMLYFRGHGVPQDDSLALKYFHQAAALGDWSSMAQIASMYTDGRGVSKDPEQAKIWSDAAARVRAEGAARQAKDQAEYDRKRNGGRDPAPDCKLADLDLTLVTHQQTDNYVLVGMQIQNLRDKPCRIERAVPSFIRVQPPPDDGRDIKICINCSAEGVPSGGFPLPPTFATVEPHGFAHVTFRWKVVPGQDAQCKPLAWINVFLQTVEPTNRVALMLGFAKPYPQVCSVVDVSTVVPGRDPYLMGAELPAPVMLQASSIKPAYYAGGKVSLLIRAQVPEPVAADHSCPLMLMRSRQASGETRYDEIGAGIWGCKVQPASDGAPPTMRLDLTTYNGIELGDKTVQFFRLSSTGDDDNAWRWLGASNPVTYRVDDPKQIVRQWGPQVKGVALDITLDKTTYVVGEEIPLHIAIGNFAADQTIGGADCGSVGTRLSDVDGGRAPTHGGPVPEPCVSSAPYPGALARGDIATIERNIGAVTEPGTYTITGTWEAWAYTGPPGSFAPVGSTPPPLHPYAIVYSQPLVIRVVDPKHPGVGRFAPSARWPANFAQTDTQYGPRTALLDKTTGLKWLHINLTDWMSYDQVQQKMTTSGSLEGWRFATADEVQKMFSDFDGAPNGISSDPQVGKVLEGALGGPATWTGDTLSHTQCLMTVDGHAVMGGLILRDSGPGAPWAVADPRQQGEWPSASSAMPVCSYLVQQADEPHN